MKIIDSGRTLELETHLVNGTVMGRRPNVKRGQGETIVKKHQESRNIKKAITRSRSQDDGYEEARKKPRIPTENIKVMMLNARGLDDVTEHNTISLIRNQKPEVMGIIETHLREEDGSRKICVPEGYMKVEVRRSDLDDDKNGGGIMVLYKRAQGVRIEEKKLLIPTLMDPSCLMP